MYRNCKLCARLCGINREAGNLGYCGAQAVPLVARAALHMWEEPPISGTRGSGTVFFSGCSLGCIYCQNREISRGSYGKEVNEQKLAEVCLDLQMQGAHNINFVTPTHYAPSVINTVAKARALGLTLPIVYNTASYETEETLDSLKDSIDIWLPDLKYYRPETALRYSNAKDLPSVSRKAIEKMVSFAPNAEFDSCGIMKRGVIVRVLLLPSHLAEAKLNVKYLYETFGDKIQISLMSQYTPPPGMKAPLDRRVTKAEYGELVDYAVKLGIKNAFIQDREAASESFIPPFDNTGL